MDPDEAEKEFGTNLELSGDSWDLGDDAVFEGTIAIHGVLSTSFTQLSAFGTFVEMYIYVYIWGSYIYI